MYTLVRWLPLSRAVPSRRAAAQAIAQGQVRVNGQVCERPSYVVRPEEDDITCHGQKVVVRTSSRSSTGSGVDKSNEVDSSSDGKGLASAVEVEHVHVIMNKPPGHLCTRNGRRQVKGGGTVPDPRPTVFDLLRAQLFQDADADGDAESESESGHSNQPHCVPIGRLDVDTTGLLLFTSDGHLNNALANPMFKVDKVYRATLRDKTKPLSEEAIKQLADGVHMKPGGGKPAVRVQGEAQNVKDQSGVVDLRIQGGYNHQVKHMLRLVGRPLAKLHRLQFANVQLDEKELQEGHCRIMTAAEVERLYQLARDRVQQVSVGQ